MIVCAQATFGQPTTGEYRPEFVYTGSSRPTVATAIDELGRVVFEEHSDQFPYLSLGVSLQNGWLVRLDGHGSAKGMNNLGRIAGFSGLLPRATIWDLDHGYQFLMPHGSASWATDINDQDTAVGYIPGQGFAWSNGQISWLRQSIAAYCISETGVIGGVARTENGLSPAIWQEESLRLPPGKRREGAVFGINKNGLAVGSSGRRAFVWDTSLNQIIWLKLAGFRLEARAVNDSGVVVGTATSVTSGHKQPFVWSADNGLRWLSLGWFGRSGEASDINNAGEIVGYRRLKTFPTEVAEVSATLWVPRR